MGLGLLRRAQHYLFAPLVSTGAQGVLSDDGPDDLWPEEESVPKADDPAVAVVTQWGLQLPNGTVAWGSWQSIPFDNPLDRMRMIATLQQTALTIGLAEGEQLAEFLTGYGWVVREATVSTVFSAITHRYPLGDPAVADASVNGSQEDAHAAS